MKVTERYTVERFEPLCEGWLMGIGHDSRLDRQVVVTTLPLTAAAGAPMDAWLTARAALSHPYAADLLDAAQTSSELICVFEGAGGHVQAGLPNLARDRLLAACVKILDGTAALVQAGIPFAFSGGQILWDDTEPRLFGLPQLGNHRSSEEDVAVALSLYVGRVLEWSLVAQADADHPGTVSTVWRLGLDRLNRVGEARCETLQDVRTVLQAMMMEAEVASRREADRTAQSPGAPVDSLGPWGIKRPGAASVPDPALRRESVNASLRPSAFDGARVQTKTPAGSQAVDEGEMDEEEGRLRSTVRRGLQAVGALPIPGEEEPPPPGRPSAVTVVGVLAALTVIGWLAFALTQHLFGYGASPGSQAATPSQGPSSGSAGQAGGKGATGSSRSSGSGRGSAGDLIGLSAPQAVARLERLGVAPGSIHVTAVVSHAKIGAVAGSSLGAGAPVTPGEAITLEVSVPRGDAMVPSLLGMTVAQASAALLAAQFHYAYVKTSQSKIPAGTVFRQSPAPYAVLPVWSNVHFTVAVHYA